MREDDFIGQAFYWFTGEVVDVKDPKKMNRVKVRCHGYHNSEIKIEDLPWAIVMMPSTSQSSGGYGRTHELEKDSWVVGFFRDGMSAQDPLVMGSIATQTSKTEEQEAIETHIIDGMQIEVSGTILKKIVDIDIPKETQDNYPDNKVYKSKAGHIVEFDNTEDKERINIEHKTGSNFSIDPNGDMYIDNTRSGGEIFIWSKNHITASTSDGDVKVVTDSGDIEVKAKLGKVDITAAGEITIASATKTRIM